MKASTQTQIQLIFDASASREEAIQTLASKFYSGNELHDLLILKGAQAAIGERVRNDNARIFHQREDADVTAPRIRLVEAPLVSGSHRRRISAGANVIQLLNVTLPNGTRMAEAKRADVEHAISTFEPQATDMLRKAAYYRMVRARLPEGKKVADVFDDAALTAMYRTAESSVSDAGPAAAPRADKPTKHAA